MLDSLFDDKIFDACNKCCQIVVRCILVPEEGKSQKPKDHGKNSINAACEY